VAVDDELRDTVIGWLEYIRDFCYLDTSPLINQARTDDDLVAAVDIAARAGTTTSQRLDQIRDLCVSLTFGDSPTQRQLQPQSPYLTPFSVPYQMLKEVFGRHIKDAYIWHEHMRYDVFNWYAHWQPHNNYLNELYLLTGVRLYNLDNIELPAGAVFTVLDQACNRSIIETPVSAIIERTMPLFYQLFPNSQIECRLRINNAPDVSQGAAFSLVLEGWKCRAR